jgi:cytochrome b6-f complex iron-sulfur subunit
LTTEHTTERNDQRGLSRRSVLVLGAAGASTVALAACSKAKSTENTPSSAGSTTSAAGSTSTSASTSPSTSALGGSSSGGAHALAKLADIPIGGAISAKDAGGSDIIITRPTDTTVEAFTAICTHMGCTVRPGSQTFVCPCHGSTYDAKTGDRISGPARGGLAKINVKVSGQSVVAG